MAKIFISYSVKDLETVKKIKRDIQAAGHTVWIYPQAIDPGEDIIVDEKKGIRDCHAVLVMESRNSVKATAVKKEIAYARQLERQTGLKKLYFACIDPRLSISVDTVQRTDLSKKTHYTTEFHRLIRKIERHRDFKLTYSSKPDKEADNWYEIRVWIEGSGIKQVEEVDYHLHPKIAKDPYTSQRRKKGDRDFCLTFYTPHNEYVFAVIYLRNGEKQTLGKHILTY